MQDTEHENHCCRVCGWYMEGYLPYGEDGSLPTFDMCDCCGVEFGYQDCQPSAARDPAVPAAVAIPVPAEKPG